MIWEENMAAGTDLSCPFTILEGNYENVSVAEDESLDSLKQLMSGKPPRHLSVVQHCVISARLLPATCSVSLSCLLLLESDSLPVMVESSTSIGFSWFSILLD